MFFKYSFTHESAYSPEKIKDYFGGSGFECFGHEYVYKDLGENKMLLKPKRWYFKKAISIYFDIYADFEPTDNGSRLCAFTLKTPKLEFVFNIITIILLAVFQAIIIYSGIRDGNWSIYYFMPIFIAVLVAGISYIVCNLSARHIKQKLLEVI